MPTRSRAAVTRSRGDASPRKRADSLVSDGGPMDGMREQIAALGNIVTVLAHPDDETYVAGGLMAMVRELGGQVTCVVATDGDFAETAAERRAIGQQRVTELRALDLGCEG